MLTAKTGSNCTRCLRAPGTCSGAPGGESWTAAPCADESSETFMSFRICQVLHHLLKHMYKSEISELDDPMRKMVLTLFDSKRELLIAQSEEPKELVLLLLNVLKGSLLC